MVDPPEIVLLAVAAFDAWQPASAGVERPAVGHHVDSAAKGAKAALVITIRISTAVFLGPGHVT